ncbi:MAG TPA: SGNH/GDSL hydrolase family protein, partial [Longimicrobium sp.]
TVAGIGAAAHEQALTGRVAAALARVTGRPVAWRAVGRSGATARDAAAHLVPILGDARVDAVVVALGVNDTLRFRPPSRWTRDVERLIGAIRARVGPAPVVLAGVPPMQCFPALPQPLRAVLGARARRLDAALARVPGRIAAAAHVPMRTDLAAHFFCADGFHPSEEGYAVWGERLAAEVARLLHEGDWNADAGAVGRLPDCPTAAHSAGRRTIISETP